VFSPEVEGLSYELLVLVGQIDDTKFHNIEEPSESTDNLYELEASRKRSSGNTLAQQDSIWGKLSHHEIEEASDELEFRETELLRKGRELREAQAKLTVSEGKLALQLSYAFFVQSSVICICMYICICIRTYMHIHMDINTDIVWYLYMYIY
jgi:hypothetical protein